MIRRLVAATAVGAVLMASAPTASAVEDGVTLVGSVPVPGAVSAKVVEQDGKPRWLYVSAASGFLVYDLSDPAEPREVGRLPLPTYQNEDLDGTADLALLSEDVPVSAENSPAGAQLVVVSTADKTRPVPVAHVPLPDGAGHTMSCLERCRWVYASNGATLVAVDLGDPARPVVHRLPLPAATGGLHDVEQDAQGLVWLSGQEGAAAVAVRPVTTLGPAVAARTRGATPLAPVVLSDTGAPGTTPAVRRGTLHGALRPVDVPYSRASGLRAGDVLLAAEESTATQCADGGRFHVFDARGVRDGRPLRLLDSVTPAEATGSTVQRGLGAGCSAHWFTQQGPLVAAAWFGAGLRVLDVSDPRRVRQVGRYVPTEPRTWSAYWVRGTPYVYALDLHRGLDVLRVDARAGGREVAPLLHGPGAPRTVAEAAAGSVCAV